MVAPRNPRVAVAQPVGNPVSSGITWNMWDYLSPVSEEVEEEPPQTALSEIDYVRDNKIMSERMLRPLDGCPPSLQVIAQRASLQHDVLQCAHALTRLKPRSKASRLV